MELLTKACNSSAKHILITGDLNFPHVDWNHWSSPEWDIAGNVFLETLDDLLLFQQVFIPTRQRQSRAPSTLDLVLSDEEHSVNNLRVTDPLARSDHFMIEFEYSCYTAVAECCTTKYLYDIGNYQDFVAELLGIEWSQVSRHFL